MTYRNLNAKAILSTAKSLTKRIEERFPQRGLGKVCADLHAVADEAHNTAEWIARPIWPLRIAIVFLVIVFAAFVLIAILPLNLSLSSSTSTIAEFLQTLEAGLNDIVLLSAALFFLITLENRIKQRRALNALHELRSLAHVIDMHQLTKDPERLVDEWVDTESSPTETMTRFELTRYLDYCSEMLSLIGKISALYVQNFDDSVALSAVNEIEGLTTGLSRKIWQKIMILRTTEPHEHRHG